MEEIFSYAQYDRVLCLYFDNKKGLRASQSSNRLIKSEDVKMVDKDTISVKDKLIEFFKLHSKSENQQTDDEKTGLSSIINFVKELKHDIIKGNESIFDKSQILFCLPAEWTEDKYKNDLRALFLKAEWINRDDHNTRLIFSTFIERFVQCLQMNGDNDQKFERERKYLLLYMGKASIRLTCYQMQSAKELIAVSKKLAASNFLLTPTVLDDETICLSNLNDIIRKKVERVLITRYNTFKKLMLHRMTNEILGRLSGIYEIYDRAHIGRDYTLPTIFKNTRLFYGGKMVQEYTEALERNPYNIFIKEILNDTDIEQLLHEAVDTFKRILGKYSQVENSPDGLQTFILWDDSYHRRLFCRDLVLDVLLNAKITKSNFIRNYDEALLVEAAMQKPYKMIQIVNAISPPDILNKDNVPLYPNLIEHGWPENDLLQPNSFYVQAYVYENHINFILNKVVAVSSIDNAVQKSTLTIKERSINIENITDTICDIMWNHFQELHCEDYGNRFSSNCCDEHGVDEFNTEDYFNFKSNLKILISNWFQDEDVPSDQELDINQSISTNVKCKCALNITYRMLIDLALIPAITNIATVITSTLASNTLFGLYNVSALIIINESENIAFNRCNIILKEVILKRLQVHQKRPFVFYGEKELVDCKLLGNWINDVKQILGRGSYLQVSSTSYMVRIGRQFQKVNDWFDCSSSRVSRIRQACNFYIIKKDDCLHQEGVIKRFIIKNSDYYDPILDIFMLSYSQGVEYRNRIMGLSYSRENLNCPFTIKISPQHYSSTVKIEVSYVQGISDPYDYSTSFAIHEKLVLKQK